MQRPAPPSHLFDWPTPRFEPAEDLASWVATTFLDEGASLENPEHSHLRSARIGTLWTTAPNSRAMRRIIGTCEFGPPRGSKWVKARAEQQLTEWFGDVPDFILTFDANYAAECDDASFCALVEHELYHAGQERDPFGMPKFHRDGSPCFTLRGHDVEEFVGVVRRYGARAAGVEDLVAAANARPTIGMADLAGACGTCLLRAA